MIYGTLNDNLYNKNRLTYLDSHQSIVEKLNLPDD